MVDCVVLSGGVDSSVALYLAAANGGELRSLTFDYGQRHRKEIESARVLSYEIGAENRVISLSGLLSGSSLIAGAPEPVPDGHYADPSMKATIVNGRNLMFASAAISACQPGDTLWFGVHAGDRFVYPDCRPEFWDRLQGLARDAYGVDIHTPFLDDTKAEIVKVGAESGVPFDLTWSCYKGGDLHCGTCGTCVERAEAFHLAEVPDPTEYADSDFWKGQV